jgi:hypothetical protein
MQKSSGGWAATINSACVGARLPSVALRNRIAALRLHTRLLRPLIPTVLLLLLISAAPRAGAARDAQQPHGDIEVDISLGPSEQSGHASATVRIHAPREVVWSLIKSCTEAVNLVPGLIACDVLETSRDQSSQLIRHVLDYSWYLPKLTYEFRASYERPVRISIERVSGDFAVLRGSWYLQSDGDYTVAHYAVELVPGFWVPHWVARIALRRDLPKMLRALRARAEVAQSEDAE